MERERDVGCGMWDVVLIGENKDSEMCGMELDDEICRELYLEGVFFEEMI